MSTQTSSGWESENKMPKRHGNKLVISVPSSISEIGENKWAFQSADRDPKQDQRNNKSNLVWFHCADRMIKFSIDYDLHTYCLY